MNKILKLFLLVLILGVNFGSGYKILVVFPLTSTSHGILGDGFVRHLLAAGHEVTYITPFVKENPHPKLQQVDVSSAHISFSHILNLKSLMEGNVVVGDINFVFKTMLNVSRQVLRNENVLRLLEDSNQQFDLVIAEWMFSRMYCGFAVVFNVPCILFFPTAHHNGALSIIDEAPNPAYTTSFNLDSVLPFSFIDRVKSLLLHTLNLYSDTFKFSPAETEAYESLFSDVVSKKGRVLPKFDDMIHNTSLIFYNSHVSLGANIRSPLNYIPIGGYHIDTEVKPLPGDLQKIMDESPNGVIYFSMGSNLQSKELPNELKQSLLTMFGSLKQTVLWKFEEQFSDVPKNVHILKWAPQPSILSHPNCVLFITHGGLLSSTETVHFGVPIIGIPVFADQFVNVNNAVQSGFAKRVDLSYTMAEKLKIAITDILGDPKYRAKVKQLSRLYHDRLVPPSKQLVYWVEHVIRTGGAPHLRSPALDVAWYERMYIDLAALIIATVVFVTLGVKRVLCAKNKVSKITKSNKTKKNN